MIRFLIPAARLSWYLFMFMLIHLSSGCAPGLDALARAQGPARQGRPAGPFPGQGNGASGSGAGAGETLRLVSQFVMAGLVPVAMPRLVLRAPVLVGV
jgi:hypothetical protein